MLHVYIYIYNYTIVHIEIQHGVFWQKPAFADADSQKPEKEVGRLNNKRLFWGQTKCWKLPIEKVSKLPFSEMKLLTEHGTHTSPYIQPTTGY